MQLNERNKIKIEKLTEISFFLSFGLLLFTKGMGLYEGQKAFYILSLLALLFYVCRMLTVKLTKVEFVCASLLLALAAVIFVRTREFGPLFHVMLITSLKGIEFRKILRCEVIVYVGTLFFHLVYEFLGLDKEQIFRIHRKIGTYVVRWSLGYTHPNVLHISYVVIIIVCMQYFRWHGKQLIKATALFFLGGCILFLWSFSFTGMLIMMIYLLMNLVADRKKRISGIEKATAALITPLAISFSVLGPIVLQGKLFDAVNKALSTRFYQSRFFLTTQPITLFGTPQSMMSLPDTSYNLDCSYVYSLIHYGILFTVLFYGSLILIVPWLIKQHRRGDVVAAICLAIAGISEPFLANSSFKNISMVFVGMMMFEMLRKHCEGRREFSILKGGEQEIAIPITAVCWIKTKARASWNDRKMIIVISALVVGILSSVFYAVSVRKPDAVYALLWQCDRKDGGEEEYCYLDAENLPDNFNGWILGYGGPEMPLYSFDGFTADFEYLRRILGHGMATAIIAGGFLMFAIPTKSFQREKLSGDDRR